jgi:hypothetical protein
MRLKILALALAAMLTGASPAPAAPVCRDGDGGTIRCGTPGAMPVGWTLPPERRAERPADPPIETAPLFELVCIVGGLFALIALMPDFDGRRSADWGDDDETGP